MPGPAHPRPDAAPRAGRGRAGSGRHPGLYVRGHPRLPRRLGWRSGPAPRGALTTQRNTSLPLSDDGAPLADAISWLDRRRASPAALSSRTLRALVRVLGEEALLPRLISKSWPLLWRERGLDGIARIATIEGWLHHALIGDVVVAPGGLVGPWPFDLGQRAGARWACWPGCSAIGALAAAHRRGRRARGPDHRVGRSATGLPEGLPLHACGGDKQAEAMGGGGAGRLPGHGGGQPGHRIVGVPALAPGSPEPCASSGSPRRPVEPASWNLEYMVFRGMWTARWFAEHLARDLLERANAEDQAVEALLEEEARGVTAGSDGVLVLPRWSPSLQHGAEAGAFLGLREVHGRGHLYRALLEGVVFDLRRGIQILERATQERIAELRVGGGGARSPLMVQILAEATGLPVRKAPDEELAARGAAVVAAVAPAPSPHFGAAVRAMVPSGELVQPDPVARRHYDSVYPDAVAAGAATEPGGVMSSVRSRGWSAGREV